MKYKSDMRTEIVGREGNTLIKEHVTTYRFDRDALERLAALLQEQYPNGDERYYLDEALEILSREVKGNG